MVANDKQAQLPPENIIPLTFEVAKRHLDKKYWTPHEAVMLIAGHDPESNPFYDDDDAN